MTINFSRSMITGLVALALSSTAIQAQPLDERKELQVVQDVARQVRQYVNFTVFDSVNASLDNGTVTLTGKVTMPYKV
ncbi:MAG: hypothetical protein H0V80_16285, partial [Acidobacteria bacterium]|nr:hypothetical protein [Acidobacteriota bacterium]